MPRKRESLENKKSHILKPVRVSNYIEQRARPEKLTNDQPIRKFFSFLTLLFTVSIHKRMTSDHKPEPGESCLYDRAHSRPILIFSSHSCMGLPNGHLPWGSHTNICTHLFFVLHRQPLKRVVYESRS
jgi:hypothetical protein